MRILVLQLARFGDIYQTWPTLSSLKRKHPGCELHVLVRQRFQDATADFPGITVHALPTQEILRPLFERDDIEESHGELRAFLEPLCDRNFDLIVNLAFSPSSSFLTDYLATSRTEVRGYTRHADGHFHIPDDASAYFYAQVGIGRANRYHLTEIFAAVAGVDLCAQDFHYAEQTYTGPRHGIVVHLGASAANKTYPPELWVEAIREILATTPVTLVGNGDERALSETVAKQLPEGRLHNFVGETSLRELFQVVGTAEILIGADSAPVHIASLTQTPVLNLSSSTVNFWETGPMSADSRVLYEEEIARIHPRKIAIEALSMMRGLTPLEPCAHRSKLLVPYELHGLRFDDFRWELVQALYTGTPFPRAESASDRLGFQRLFELSELALQQLERWPTLQDVSVPKKILAQIDILLKEVAELSPGVDPVVQWFETQRLRIPPGTHQEILLRTRQAFQELFWVASVFREHGSRAQVASNAIALCRACIPELRECNMSAVTNEFQNLVSGLHELARHSTKVAGETWPSVLAEMNAALERRDYIHLADFLEWKMTPALHSHCNEIETLNPDL